jgi:hypothetical protein
VARQGTNQYAFYRGTTYVGAPPAPANAPAQPPSADKPAATAPTLEGNLRIQNSENQSRQMERLQDRFKQAPAAPSGVQVEKAY